MMSRSNTELYDAAKSGEKMIRILRARWVRVIEHGRKVRMSAPSVCVIVSL